MTLKRCTKIFGFALVVVACVICAVLIIPAPAQATQSGSIKMWRLYNPYSGEHLYTYNESERDTNASIGWRLEGFGWIAPEKSSTPVYRLYNPYSGDHHYTVDYNEYTSLGSIGWNQEGIGWYSDDTKTVPIYREFNPYEQIGTHNYTSSLNEDNTLASKGWIQEGVAWYGLEMGQSYTAGSNIMGTSTVSAQSMADWFRSKQKSYPAEFAAGGASSIDDFTKIVWEEAAAEGVRADVVFCQAMLETGYLQYTGQVSVKQLNFCGLKTTDGSTFASFNSVREGVRAHVQHLKCYASTDSLNNPCVDPRFDNVVSMYGRGSAPSVEMLSEKWASGASYGTDLMNFINGLIEFAS
jgi:hypothetical protein